MVDCDKVDIKKIIKADSVILALLGSSGCGKSTLLKHIIEECIGEFTHIFLYQGSSPSNDNIYINYVWPENINYIDNLDKNTINLKREEISSYCVGVSNFNIDIEDKISKNGSNDKVYKKIKTLIIFDDFGANNKYFTNFTNVSRHSLTSFVFLIHNDTNLDKTLRDKITHYFININYNINQIGDYFKPYRSTYESIRKRFIEMGDTKNCFLLVDMSNQGFFKYINLSKEETEKIKKQFITHYFLSKQRMLIKNEIKKVIQILNKKNEEETINGIK